MAKKQFMTDEDRRLYDKLMAELRGLSPEARAARQREAEDQLRRTTTQWLATVQLEVRLLRETVLSAKALQERLASVGTAEALSHARVLGEAAQAAALRRESPGAIALLSLPDGSSGDHIRDWVNNLVSSDTHPDLLSEALEDFAARVEVLTAVKRRVTEALSVSQDPKLRDLGNI